MTGVLLLALFSEVNWSLCKQADPSGWLHTEIAFDGMVAVPWLLEVADTKSWLPGCDWP